MLVPAPPPPPGDFAKVQGKSPTADKPLYVVKFISTVNLHISVQTEKASNRCNNYIFKSLVRSYISRRRIRRLLAPREEPQVPGAGKARGGKVCKGAQCLLTDWYLLCAQALYSCAYMWQDIAACVDCSLGLLLLQVHLPISAYPPQRSQPSLYLSSL